MVGLRSSQAEHLRRLQAPVVDVPLVGTIAWSSHPGKCLDVADGRTNNGNKLQLWDCSGSDRQQFTYDPLDKRIRWAAHPGLCVDIKDHRVSHGTDVQLWACGPTNTDQAFDVAASGQGRIRWTRHPSVCLDVRDHSSRNGNRIQTWDCQGANPDQVFTFGRVAPPTEAPPTDGPAADAYDVIVVGSGLMGSAVAARLAEKLPSSRRILVLEAGRASHKSLGGTDPPASLNADGSWTPWANAVGGGLTRYDVPGNYPTMDCWQANCPESFGREVPSFQCKVLGGCGVMNGALSHVPPQGNFAAWPRGWRWADLAPYFEEVQRLFTLTPTPSVDGRHYLEDTGADAVRRALKAAGMAEGQALKPKAGTMGIPYVTAADGLRQSTASLFLPAAMERATFELRLQSKAVEILRQGGRAIGVRYVDASGAGRAAALAEGGLLVLAGGALNTPRLLLASGIGPSGAVRNANVGRGVSDHAHLSAWFSAPPSDAVSSFASWNPDTFTVRQYTSGRSGGLAQYGPTCAAYIRDPTTAGSADDFDVEVWVTPSRSTDTITMGLVLLRPTCSSADLRVGGADHRATWASNRLHLACERDRQSLDYAFQLVRRQLEAHGAHLRSTSPALHDGRVVAANAMNHWAGSCALGRCADAESLLVRGTENVAVADASLLPGQVWGHPALTLQAMGLKVGDTLARSLL